MEEFTLTQVSIQLPKRLKQQVEARAQANARSMDGELVEILRQALETGPETTVTVPLTPAMRAWLEYRATEDHEPETAEIARLIDQEMRAYPLTVYVHECEDGAAKRFAVSVGLFGDDFFSTEDREEAIAVARLKAEELGLQSHGSIIFNSEISADI
ncbi:MAG: Arc family DNA-binding protein [Hyphomicrobiales bacterium]|nr:Arc family DNA-binding protein [Hyphomicrobiales bacterium]MBV8664117.1 Arc family DNA-binding protein [Hyphomicrobiales bacterium]